ncbi:MAG: AmfC protein [Acidimicrobiia bacterium]|nr:AmfC protein [Acidimicrobiia bacterium]
MATGELDRLLDPDYLGDLQARPIEEVRSMRDDCRRAEDGLSFVRRQAQGRLDIVAAELSRRNEGKGPSDAADIVDQLPAILGHSVTASGDIINVRTTSLEPPPEASQLIVELEGILHESSLLGLGQITDDELRQLVDRLTEYERIVSDRRRALHDRLDALQAEIVRRYKTGEVSVESLLK